MKSPVCGGQGPYKDCRATDNDDDDDGDGDGGDDGDGDDVILLEMWDVHQFRLR
jgi:hypothetical protein